MNRRCIYCSLRLGFIYDFAWEYKFCCVQCYDKYNKKKKQDKVDGKATKENLSSSKDSAEPAKRSDKRVR